MGDDNYYCSFLTVSVNQIESDMHDLIAHITLDGKKQCDVRCSNLSIVINY